VSVDPTRPTRIEIEGAVYQIRRWSFSDGRAWLFRLLRIAAKAAPGAGLDKSSQAALGELLDDMTLPLFEELWTCAAGYTDLVQVRDGREAVLSLLEVQSVHMQGRYFTMAALLRAHLTQEFGPFFGQIRTLLGDAGVTSGTKAEGAAAS
jgi:hypothetical protein